MSSGLRIFPHPLPHRIPFPVITTSESRRTTPSLTFAFAFSPVYPGHLPADFTAAVPLFGDFSCLLQ